MRTLNSILVIMLMVLCAVSVDGIYYTGDSPLLSASVESITPYPAEPGQDVSLQLRIYNNGQGLAKDVTVELDQDEMLKQTGQGSDFSKPFSLCSSCSKDNLYAFSVSSDAKSADYPIVFRIKTGDTVKEETIYIKVIGSPDIIIETSSSTDKISLGSSFDLDIKLRNVGTGIARNIKLSPSTPGFVIEDSNILFVAELSPGEMIQKRTRVLVSDAVQPGSQNLVFDIAYKDEMSSPVATKLGMGILLQSDVDMGISSISFNPQVIKTGSNVQVIVRVENLGEGEAKNVQVQLESSSLSGQKKSFIGKLDEDEDAPAYFMLSSGGPGTADMKVIVSYEDDLGAHEISDTIPVIIAAPKAATALIIIFALALASGAFLYFRRKR